MERKFKYALIIVGLLVAQYFVSSFILTFEISLIATVWMIAPIPLGYVYITLAITGLILGFLYMIIMKKLLVDLKTKYHLTIGIILGLIGAFWVYVNGAFIISSLEPMLTAEIVGIVEIPDLNIMIVSYFIPFILPFVFRILRK